MNQAIEISTETAVRIADHAKLVGLSVDDLVEFMKTGDETLGRKIKQDEHDADLIKMRNLQRFIELNTREASPLFENFTKFPLTSRHEFFSSFKVA